MPNNTELQLTRACIRVSRIWLAHKNVAALGDPATTIASAKQREPDARSRPGSLKLPLP